jgi:hypothetical protein
MTNTESWRRSGRECTEAYRDRRRHGRVLVPVDVSPRHLAALERLALLDADERDKALHRSRHRPLSGRRPVCLGVGRRTLAGNRESGRVS